MDNYPNINISEKSIEKKFAVLSFDNAENIDEEKISIINSEKENLLHVEVENVKEKINILYDITNKITFEEYLKDKVLRVSEFSNILLQILRKLKEVETTKLKGFSFFDSKSIYIDRYSENIYFICIPLKADGNFELAYEFSRLIKTLIVEVVRIDDRENFISKILNILRKKVFNIDEFEELLKKYSKDEIENKVEVEEEQLLKHENYKEEPIITQAPELSETVNPKTEIIVNSDIRTEDKENNYIKDIIKMKKTRIRRLNIRYALIILALQLVAAAGVFSVVLFFDNQEYLIESIIISLILGMDLILTLILILNLSNKKRAYEVKAASKSTENIRNITAKNTNSIKLSKREIVSEMSYSTQIIEEEYPYLAQNKNGVVQKIYINKDVFKIGRLDEFVDYVSDNKAVGKMHAEIRKINSEYYIKDLNSKNGTYINNKRLESNELYKIKENDVIKFADSSYAFRLN
ncbi:FHA domain-containing protein [Clostridium hydrogenum]|uniref:FHA domain-containing protein n=1 Tax=Clostridium hydrogenum TaxID=2855764 RepID=UPI001F297945|nr:FHA domain-containing protein [Clostridium hydrogenum]